jgi:hypothetical protein
MGVQDPFEENESALVEHHNDRRPTTRSRAVVESRASRRAITRRETQITLPSRPRSLVGQMSMALLEPNAFFRALPFASGRQWLWTGLLILLLVGLSAVRQETLSADSGAPAIDLGGPPIDDLGGGGGGAIISGGGGGIAISPGPMGGPMPSDPGLGGPVTTPTPTADVSQTWTTALLAASHVVLGWAVLSVLLSEVTLFNGRAPELGLNMRLAVWATVPLGLMAALQLIFFAAGGKPGEPGLVGLLSEWEGYATLPLFAKSLVLSLASRLTLFWVWSLVLVTIGARRALEGKPWAVALVVAAWAVVLVVAPVVTGAVKAEEAPISENIDLPPSEMLPGLESLLPLVEGTPEAGMPGGMDAPPVDFAPMSPEGEAAPAEMNAESGVAPVETMPESVGGEAAPVEPTPTTKKG